MVIRVRSVAVLVCLLGMTAVVGAQMPTIVPFPPLDVVAPAAPVPAMPSSTTVPSDQTLPGGAPDAAAPETDTAPSEESSAWAEWLPIPDVQDYLMELWEGSIEMGLNASEGNSQTFSYKSGARLKRSTESHVMDLNINYVRTNARGVETQHNALLNTNIERLLGESPWSLFVRFNLEYDEFKAFDTRLALYAGAGYKLWRTDTTTLTGRLGSGASREFGGPDDQIVPEAVAGFDFEHKLTNKQKLVIKADYFPEWSDFDHYRLVADLGWEVLLDEEHNLSLKLAAQDRYDSTPNGKRPNDINYSLLLLWKL